MQEDQTTHEARLYTAFSHGVTLSPHWLECLHAIGWVHAPYISRVVYMEED